MKPIDTPNSQDGKFVNGTGSLVVATEVDAKFLNAVQAELLGAIEGAGIVPKDEPQLMQAILALAGPSEISPWPRTVLVGTEIDLSAPAIYVIPMVSDLALTVAAGVKQGQLVLLEVSGDYRLALPAGTRVLSGRHDGSNGKLSTVVLTCVDAATPIFEARIFTAKPKVTGIVFRQTAGNYFADEAAALDTPSATPEAASLYSALGRVEDFRDLSTGLFHFRLVVDGVAQWEFFQESNPLDRFEAVEGYQLVAATGGFDATGFGGLSRSSYAGTVLDGQPGVRPSVAPPGGVFGAVGWLQIAASAGLLTGGLGVINASTVELHAD